ncbi:hypothetical protein [Clostridioides sp. ES-W-0016-02]|nr:hypothetical protein IC758_09810 [Clostridioides sp. ES-W-0016-02]
MLQQYQNIYQLSRENASITQDKKSKALEIYKRYLSYKVSFINIDEF